MEDPDWFFDPVTGTRAPQIDYCFKVNHRSEDVTGNVKQVWELSRMHHLTVLAAAFSLSGDERYATRAASHLRSWWAQNPFLSGVHWTSGIEAGLRLISWVWVRRLLDGWDGAADLFERNEVACAQIWWHQHYLASFRSRGSSANNHVIAESAGLLVAALAFDLVLRESSLGRGSGAGSRAGAARATPFPAASIERWPSTTTASLPSWRWWPQPKRAGRTALCQQDLWGRLYRMFDVIAATVDVKVRAPRYWRWGQRDGSGS